MTDARHVRVRDATAAWLANEAATRGTTVTLCGTKDPWPPATLKLWLFGPDDRLLVTFSQLDPPGWATPDELLEALAPWLGELPFGEKDALSHSAPILTAAPGAAPSWRPV